MITYPAVWDKIHSQTSTWMWFLIHAGIKVIPCWQNEPNWGLNMLTLLWLQIHYSVVIMSTMAYQVTGVPIVCSTVCSGADQRKHQSTVWLAFVRGIHRSPVNFPHKGPVTPKMFSFDNVIMSNLSEHSDAKPSVNIRLTTQLGMIFVKILLDENDFEYLSIHQRPLFQIGRRDITRYDGILQMGLSDCVFQNVVVSPIASWKYMYQYFQLIIFKATRFHR